MCIVLNEESYPSFVQQIFWHSKVSSMNLIHNEQSHAIEIVYLNLTPLFQIREVLNFETNYRLSVEHTSPASFSSQSRFGHGSSFIKNASNASSSTDGEKILLP